MSTSTSLRLIGELMACPECEGQEFEFYANKDDAGEYQVRRTAESFEIRERVAGQSWRQEWRQSDAMMECLRCRARFGQMAVYALGRAGERVTP